MSALTIGLTGGIGCGKSTVAKLFAQLGIVVIDTDVIARDVVKPGTDALKKIVKHFGTAILMANGELNRDKLKKIVFADAEARLWLEGILHPLIVKKMCTQIKTADSPYVIVAIPLLVETNSRAHIDRVLVVDCPRQVQIKRTQQRDHLSTQHIEAILKTQASREQRLKHADDVISNEGSLVQLQQQVARLHQRYLVFAKKC